MTLSRVDLIAREAADRLANLDPAHTWQQRASALVLVMQSLTGSHVEVVPVRAALYSRSAVYRLGGCTLPAHQGEVAHFREQVGPAMVLLGIERPHAVLMVGTTMIELADAREWHDRGVLLRPFVANRPSDLSGWSINGLRYGVCVAYEHRPDLAFDLTPDLVAHRLARDVFDAFDHGFEQLRHAT